MGRAHGFICVLLATLGCGRIGFAPGLGADEASRDGDLSALTDTGCAATPTPTTTLFWDDFEDGVPSAWATPMIGGTATLGEIDGKLVGTTATMSTKAEWNSFTFDLRGQTLVLEIVAAPDPSSGALAYTYCWTGTTRVGIVIAGGNLDVHLSGLSPSSSQPWDPIAHRWIRIRELAGTTMVEASPDGRAFSELGMTNTQATASAMQFMIGVSQMGTGNAAQASFDNLNLLPACP